MKKAALLLMLVMMLLIPAASGFEAVLPAAATPLEIVQSPETWQDAAPARADAELEAAMFADTPETAPEAPQPAAILAAQAEDVSVNVQPAADPSGSASFSASSYTAAATTSTLPVAGAVKYTKSLKFDGYNAYNTSFSYVAPVTGLYYFADLNTSNSSGIIIYDSTGKEIDYDLTIFTSFSLLTPLKAGYKYTIYMEVIGAKSLSYVMTTPLQLGTSAYTVKSNGNAYGWIQSFTFTVSNTDIYSFHLTTPANCEFTAVIFDQNYQAYYGFSNDRETYDFDIFPPGTYHMAIQFTNYSSKTDTYTLSMDAEGNTHMNNGVPVNTTLTAGDKLTTNAFQASVSGYYRFTCSRSDARLTLYDFDAEGFKVTNASSTTTLYFTAGDTVAIFIDTNGTAGAMTYTMTYLSPDPKLSNITVSAGTLSPAFASGTGSYTLPVDSVASKSVTITPVPAAPGATIRIDGVVQSSKTYTVTSATNQTVSISCTSPDGSNVQYYDVWLRALAQGSAVTSTGGSLSFDGHFLTANVGSSTTQLTVSPYVSDYATWKLYSDAGCSTPISGTTLSLSEGLNKAYLKVTSEDLRNSTVYPILVYRASDTAEPRILAYNSGYGEISDGTLLASSVRVKLFGKADLIPEATRNGEAVSWPADGVFGADGVYALKLTDGNGVSASFGFTIDKTAPAIAAKNPTGGAVGNGALVNQAVTVTVTDANPGVSSAKKNGASIAWPSDNTFGEDGAYTLSVADAVGNTSTFSFTVDRTAPTVSATCGGTLSNNAFVKGSVTVTVSDTHFSSKSVTKNGAALTWPSNGVFSTAAVYVVTAKDTLGNVRTFTFTIDKTAPTISAKTTAGKTVKNNKSANKDVVLSVSETNVASKTVTRDGAAYAWPANNTFTLEGKYVATVTDKSGNTVTFTFTIDKMPVLSVTTQTTGTALASGSYTNQAVRLSLTDAFLTSKTLKRAGRTITWPSDGLLTTDGAYSVSAKDKYGNSLSFSFTIDRTAPVVTAKTQSGKVIASGGATSESYLKLSITDLTKYTKSVTRDGISMSYPSNNTFKTEGVYVVTLKDSAGNVSVFTFAIDRTVPVINCQTSAGALARGAVTNRDVTVTVSDRTAVTKTLTRNGAAIAWPAGGVVSTDGAYTVTAKDSAGNTAASFSFTLDKTGPGVTAMSGGTSLAGGGASKNSVTVTVSGNASAPTATKNGASFAWPAGGVFSDEGLYVVSARDTLGNVTTFTFTIDKTAPVIGAENSDGTLEEAALSHSAVTVTVSGNASSVTATRDGVSCGYPADGVFAEEDGDYVVTAADAAGNQTVFSFTLDLPPAITAESGGLAVADDSHTAGPVALAVSGEAEKTLTKDGVEIDWADSLTEDGVYVITAEDASGNESSLGFTLDSTLPVLTAVLSADGVTPVLDASTVADGVTLSLVEANLDTLSITLDGAEYRKYPLLPEDEALLLWDGTLPIPLTENGVYVITVTDKAGNTVTLTFTLALE